MTARNASDLVLVNATSGRILATRVRVARSVWMQLVGLIGRRKSLGPDEALGLPGCGAVHTAGMRVSLDIAFCDANGRVRRIVAALPPWRVATCSCHRREPAAAAGGAVQPPGMAWEARAGTLAPHVRPGDVLALIAGSDAAASR